MSIHPRLLFPCLLICLAGCTRPATPPPREFSSAPDSATQCTWMSHAMTFAARWGSACGTPFDAAAYLKRHPQFSWMEGALKSRASYSWVTFRAGERQE